MPQQLIQVLVPLAVLGIVFLRARRARRVRLELLWVTPVLITLLVTAGVVFTPHRAPFMAGDLVLFVAAATVGAIIGWFRAKAVRLSIDAATHDVSSTTSPLGLAIIMAVFIVRLGLRSAAQAQASTWRIDPAVVGDALLLLAVGLVIAQRVEVFLRAKRLLTQAESPSAGVLNA